MKTCTFFGNKDAPSDIRPLIRATIIDLIENHNVDTFYVGNQGAFDNMIYLELKELKKSYPFIEYSIVLAYLPKNPQQNDLTDYSLSIYPEGLETVPRKFAIDRRNRIMIDRSDLVVTYIRHAGSAKKFADIAANKGKEIIEIIK